MFICMAAITGIGFLIKYTLISGQERRVEYGDNVELYLFGMNRHEWGSIHLIIGFVLLGLLVLHIILHWTFITCVYNRMFQKKLIKRLSIILFITVCSLFVISPFFIKPEIGKIALERRRETANKNLRANKERKNTKSINIDQRYNLPVEIKGYMTIGEISKKYKIPTNVIKTSLNIPISIPNNQKLSWIRKKHNFEMHDVEKIIKEYQKGNK